MAHQIDLPKFTTMVSAAIHSSIEDAVYSVIKPQALEIAKEAAKRIAQQVKGHAQYSMASPYGEPTIILTFNGEEIKL